MSEQTMEKQIEDMAKIIHGYCKSPCPNGGCEGCYEYKIAEKLYAKGYRKQRENVIELPFKLGSWLYVVSDAGIFDLKADDVTITKINDDEIEFIIEKLFFHPCDFGRTVFLSEEEAEKALAERSNR